MSKGVSVEVTFTVQRQAKGEVQSTNLDLEKIHQEITKRDKDTNKAKELLSFLIAVEAVEKLNDVNAGGKVVFSLPEAVAGLLVGKLYLKLTGSTGVVSNQQANTANKISQSNQDANKVCVEVVVVNATSENNTLEIAGEFYKDNENGKDKWRPWWRSSTSTKVGGEWEIPVPSGWPDKPNQDKLDPDNPASKCVIFLRDIRNAKTLKYICPWSKELLMEITQGSGELDVTVASDGRKVFTFIDSGPSFNLLGVPTIDHLVPESIGGANHTNNLLTVSQRANFAKGNFFPLDPKSWETRKSYIDACKEAANSPATFLEVMQNYIKESYKNGTNLSKKSC
jgi:hypothetical protein